MSYVYKEKIESWEWYDSPSVTSTNDEIKKLIGEKKLIALSAESQSGGRGRRGKKWQNFKGNLYFSYTLPIRSYELSKFVCLIGLCLAKTVKSLDSEKDIKIKWPNDVFLSGGKLSGILLENYKDDLWIIGIGVNIKKSPKLDNNRYKATSLYENEINLDRISFLKLYLNFFAKDLQRYQKEGFPPFRKEWLTFAQNLGQPVSIKNENTEKEGVFLNLDDNGYLVLKTKKGEERIVAGDLFETSKE